MGSGEGDIGFQIISCFLITGVFVWKQIRGGPFCPRDAVMGVCCIRRRRSAEERGCEEESEGYYKNVFLC